MSRLEPPTAAVSAKLKRLGIETLPEMRSKSFAEEDLFQILKTVELLLMEKFKIEENTDLLQGKRIDPLLAQTKQQKAFLFQLSQEQGKLDSSISETEQGIQDLKDKRASQRRLFKEDLDEIQRKIDALSSKLK